MQRQITISFSLDDVLIEDCSGVDADLLSDLLEERIHADIKHGRYRIEAQRIADSIKERESDKSALKQEAGSAKAAAEQLAKRPLIAYLMQLSDGHSSSIYMKDILDENMRMDKRVGSLRSIVDILPDSKDNEMGEIARSLHMYSTNVSSYEVSQLAGISLQRVSQLANTRELKGVRKAGRWMFDPDSVARYLLTIPNPGGRPSSTGGESKRGEDGESYAGR